MPPKRKSSTLSELLSKRARTEYVITRRKSRWSRISGSANAEAGYKEKTKGSEAYSYICLCDVPIDHRLVDDEDDLDNECDGGETCLCKTPVVERPDHPWIMSNAGYHKLQATLIQLSLRNPDSLHLHTYNDHSGYGCMEVIENLLLDFDESKDNREEQWVICEVAAVLLLREETVPLFMVDDGEMVTNLCNLVGTMFLTMLATLERHNLLKPDSEIKSLPLVMALYIGLATQSFPVDVFNDLDTRVLAYANKHKIQVRDVPGLNDSLDELQTKADKTKLPEFKARRYDPWQWRKNFEDYQDEVEELPFYAIKPNSMGGDGLDITTWSSDRRKKHSFSKKDPLGEEVIESLKKGLVVQLA